MEDEYEIYTVYFKEQMKEIAEFLTYEDYLESNPTNTASKENFVRYKNGFMLTLVQYWDDIAQKNKSPQTHYLYMF